MKSIILATLMVTAALSAGGCGTPKAPSPSPAASSSVPAVHQINEESQQIYRKAVTAYGKGDHLHALELANQALEKDGENYKALSLKGIIQAFDISPEEGIGTIQNPSPSTRITYRLISIWPWPRNWGNTTMNPSASSRRCWIRIPITPGPTTALPPTTLIKGTRQRLWNI